MNELITTTRAESKSIVKNLSEAARIECDKVFALRDTLEAAEKNINASMLTFEPQLCDSFSKIAADTDGIKKAGYDTFKDFAAAAFGIADKAASMYKRVGDKFFNVEKRPAVAAWYSASKLQELRNVDNDRLEKDAASGVLKPDMTLSMLREYAASVKAESLTDGEESVAVTNGFVAVILPSGKPEVYANEAAIFTALNGGEAPLADNIHTLSSSQTIIVKGKSGKDGKLGKDKEIKTRMILVEHSDGSVSVARFWKNPAALTKDDKAKAAEIRAALERYGIDTSDMTAQELLNR